MAVPIVYQNFIPPAIDAGNLNTINNVVYTVIGDGVNAPLNGANVRTNIGLGNVDNTSDANKPLSTATIAALLAQNPGRLLNIVRLTGAGVYTPTAGTTRVLVEILGGGGAGGGSPATAAGQLSCGTGGGAGALAVHLATSGFTGAAYSVGTGGTGVAGSIGNAGGASTFLGVSAPGGIGGASVAATANAAVTAGGVATALATGANVLNGSGGSGSISVLFAAAAAGLSGTGANSLYGGGGTGVVGNLSGNNATGFGAGGGGGFTLASSPVEPGGSGSPGTIIVYEYS